MNLPSYYEFYNPVKIVAGEKALENIPHEIKLLQAKRPIIITDQGIEKAGLLRHVLNGFDDSDLTIGVVFTETPVDSSVHTVNQVAELFREENCDSIIAVGGGSVIDTAKAVNIVVSENTSDLMLFAGSDRLKSPQKPLMIIPTTAGTGSEVTAVAMISDTDRNMKIPFASQFLLPKVAILDPRMTLTLPPRITAATTMDALTHAIEAYSGLQKNPMSDAYAIAAISLIRDNLYPAIQNGKDVRPRFALANAALMAGASFANSMVGAVHAISHSVGAIAHVPHGVANAILLPHVMEFNFEKVHDLYAELLLPLIGEEVFLKIPKEKRAKKTIEKIKEMNAVLHELCDHPTRLSDAGVKEEQLPDIARASLDDGSVITNLRELEYNDALAILRKAM